MENSIDSFFQPHSIALIGASVQEEKISNVILKSLIQFGFKGKIYPINPRYKEVEGLRCYPAIGSIRGKIDLAVYAIPAERVPDAIKEAKGKVKGAIVVSGGFKESGPKGMALEKELKSAAVSSGIRVIGPNCLGIVDTVSRMDTFFVPPGRAKRPPRGKLAILSQSGSFAVTAMDELASQGIGISRIVSYGNRADVDEAECLEFLASDKETGAVALYMESVEDGRRFVEAAGKCAARKPVMAVKVGKAQAGMAAAASHTGALAGRYELYRAAFRKAGLIEADGYEEFIAGCKALSTSGPPASKRVFIITDGGGIGVNIADACSRLNLEMPPIEKEAADELRASLPSFFSVSNPMDLTGSVTDELFGLALEKALQNDTYGLAIIAALWGPPALTDRLPAVIAGVGRRMKKPVLVCSPGGEFTRKKDALFRRQGLPVFRTPEEAARAAAVLAKAASKLN